MQLQNPDQPTFTLLTVLLQTPHGDAKYSRFLCKATFFLIMAKMCAFVKITLHCAQ